MVKSPIGSAAQGVDVDDGECCVPLRGGDNLPNGPVIALEGAIVEERLPPLTPTLPVVASELKRPLHGIQ